MEQDSSVGVFQVYMACQSMLIVLVGYTPQYQTEQQDGSPLTRRDVTFTEDVDSIATEVSRPRPLAPVALCGTWLETCLCPPVAPHQAAGL